MRFLLRAIVIACFATTAAVPGWTESTAQQRDGGIAVLPILGSSPEDGVIVGALGLFYRTPEGATSTDTISAGVMYGTAGSYALSLSIDRRLGKRGATVLLDSYVSLFSSEYFGIGMETETSVEYRALETETHVAVLVPVARRIVAGPAIGFRFLDVIEVSDDSSPYTETVSPRDRVIAAGAGVRAIVDSRDNTMYPSNGVFAETASHHYPSQLGSDGGFTIGTVDLRYFTSPLPWLIVGSQVRFEASAGAVPDLFLPAIGGEELMRGVLSERFRDQMAIAGQLEFRFPLIGRFGATAFIGTGQVSASIPEIRLTRFVPAGGAGLRFAIDPKEMLNLRLDFAHDLDSLKVYVGIMEAF